MGCPKGRTERVLVTGGTVIRPYTCIWLHFRHPGVVYGRSFSNIFYYFEWSSELIDNLLDSARVGIVLDLKMSFDDVANFKVLGWG